MIKEYDYLDPQYGLRTIGTGNPEHQAAIEAFIAENCERVGDVVTEDPKTKEASLIVDMASEPVLLLDAIRIDEETKKETGTDRLFTKMRLSLIHKNFLKTEESLELKVIYGL